MCDLGRFPPHFGGYPPRAGGTPRSPGSGREAPPWNPHLPCVAIAKAWRLGAGSLSGHIVAPMDSTSSRSIKRVYVVPTRSPRHRKRAAASKTDSPRAVFTARREQQPPSTGPVGLECPKWPKNVQNGVKIEIFQTFPNGPKWSPMASKWSKMAPKRIFGRFGPVLGAFWPVPPSLWGVSPWGWAHPALPGIWLGGTPLEPIFVLCGHRQDLAPGSWLPERPNGFYIVREMKTGICGAHTLA